MEMLSEHPCQGWLEGYLLTGRHGFFSCYEAFIHIVDSMFNQHAKWLKVTRDIPWRRPIASLNYLLTSHVWRQDHNGFSHQDPGFIDHVVNKKAEIVRVYLPPDANMPALGDRSLPAQPQLRERDRRRASSRRCSGSTWTRPITPLHRRASASGSGRATTTAAEPDVVMACAGDVPTLETLAAVDLLRQHFPDLKIRVVNVVDLMTLAAARPSIRTACPTASSTRCSPTNKPIIFAYHGYPWLIHRLTYRRTNHDNMHVRGYKEEGTTTTPFDMVVLNDLDRFHLALDVIDRVPRLAGDRRALRGGAARQAGRAHGVHPRARRGHARGARLDVVGVRGGLGPAHRGRRGVTPGLSSAWGGERGPAAHHDRPSEVRCEGRPSADGRPSPNATSC